MNGDDRRNEILKKLNETTAPLSGSSLAGNLNVSRQIIVQDIALLRAAGNKILSANRGYILMKSEERPRRVFKVRHSHEETEEELNLFVDCGAKVIDIFIYHKIYGRIEVPLNLSSRLDVQKYMENLNSGKSKLLSRATSGYHYHTIEADSDGILDLILESLDEKGFLANLTDHEPIDFK